MYASAVFNQLSLSLSLSLYFQFVLYVIATLHTWRFLLPTGRDVSFLLCDITAIGGIAKRTKCIFEYLNLYGSKPDIICMSPCLVGSGLIIQGKKRSCVFS